MGSDTAAETATLGNLRRPLKSTSATAQGSFHAPRHHSLAGCAGSASMLGACAALESAQRALDVCVDRFRASQRFLSTYV